MIIMQSKPILRINKVSNSALIIITIITLSILRRSNSSFVGNFKTATSSLSTFKSTFQTKFSTTSTSSSTSKTFIDSRGSLLLNHHHFNRKSFIRNTFSQTSRSSSYDDSFLDYEYTYLEGTDLQSLTIVQIKDILRSKGLKLSGRKADLIKRLLDHTDKASNNQENLSLLKEENIMPRKSPRKRNDDGKSTNNDDDVGEEQQVKVKQVGTSKAASTSKLAAEGESAPPKAKKTKVEAQRITERDELTKLWNVEEALQKGSYTFKIMSWNVAGLRALIRKEPNALSNLVSEHDLDVICLQETKLQQSHIDDPKLNLKSLLAEDGYDSHFSCSTAKKGYAGTCVFVKQRKSNNDGSSSRNKSQGKLDSFFVKKTSSMGANSSSNNHDQKNDIGDIDVKDLIPTNISMKMGKDEHDSEGRIITVEYPKFSVTNLYVPNSGQNLERLSYRTQSWDKDLLQHMKEIEESRKKPVIWLGDLNVAHEWRDCWNDGAKHLAKQAGTTPEEKESFQHMLDNGSFVDAFRFLYPHAKGHYTYWSQRAGNRGPNKGLRLDYFICSSSLMEDTGDNGGVIVRDSYMIPNQNGSDHCPVVLEMEMRKK